MEKQENQSGHKKEDSKPKQNANAYMKYSGMGIQLLVIIFIGTFIGQKLDAHFQVEEGYFTAALALFSTLGGLYLILKDLIKQ